jgi:signal transduction histidine kinase
MSHELRTPLNAIIGFSEVIERELFGEIPVRRYLNYARDIRDSGNHLLTLINDVLDMAKVESGKWTLVEEALSAAQIIGETLRLFSAPAEAAQIALDTLLAPGLPPIQGDRRALVQVLINLVGNAVKFTPAGGRIEVTAALDPDGRLCLGVRDDGIGMRPADIPLALEPFGQIESPLSRRHHGTGLGLPLVKALVDLHGGELRVSSDLGRGTLVQVLLPAERCRPPAA